MTKAQLIQELDKNLDELVPLVRKQFRRVPKSKLEHALVGVQELLEMAKTVKRKDLV